MYGFSVVMNGEFDFIIEQVTAALKEQGFGVLTDIDVKATLKAKLGEEMLPYRILGACAPKLAHQALTFDPELGLLLPCNVVVRAEQDGSVKVSFIDPKAMFSVIKNPEVAGIADKVTQLLLNARDALAET